MRKFLIIAILFTATVAMAQGVGQLEPWLENDPSPKLVATLDANDQAITSVGYIDFDLTNGIAQAEGRLVWNPDEGTLNLGMPGGDVVGQLLQEILIQGKNSTGDGTTNGRPVRISGASGNKPTFAFSDADNPAAAGSVGLFTEDVNINGNGYVTTFGLVREIDTSGGGENWSAGDRIYVGNTAGTLTNIAPTGSERRIFIGIVLNAHASTGIIWVHPINVSYLSELSGNVITSVADKDLLQYDSASSTWLNVNGTGTGSIGYWSRAGTTISPVTAGDAITTTGLGTFGTLDATELCNSAGDLKLQPDAQGNITLFEDVTLPGNDIGKKLIIYRNSTDDGTDTLEIFIQGSQAPIFQSSAGLSFATAGSGGFNLFSANDITMRLGNSAAKHFLVTKFDNTNMLDIKSDATCIFDMEMTMESGSLRVKTDTGKILYGAGEDASVGFDGDDLVIDNAVNLGTEEVHFTDFVKYAFDDDVQLGDANTDIHGINTAPQPGQMLTASQTEASDTTLYFMRGTQTYTGGSASGNEIWGYQLTQNISGNITASASHVRVGGNFAVTDSSEVDHASATVTDWGVFANVNWTGPITDANSVTPIAGEFLSQGNLGTAVGDTEHYAVKGTASGTADTNYGAYLTASDATINYALWTEAGDVVMKDADTWWEGDGSGVPYGSFYGNEIADSLVVNNSYIRIDDTDCVSGEVNLVTYSDSPTTLTISKAGRYLITWAISGEVSAAGAGQHVLGGIMIDSTSALQAAGQTHSEPTAAAKQITIAGTAIIDCPNGTEVIGVGAGSAANITITIDHVNLTITLVGGT